MLNNSENNFYNQTKNTTKRWPVYFVSAVLGVIPFLVFLANQGQVL